MTEIRFVPDDASSLDSMFTAMSECQVYTITQNSCSNSLWQTLLFQQLHPDTDDSISEAEEEEVILLSSYVQRSKILHFNLALPRECMMTQRRMVVPMVVPMVMEERRVWTPTSTTQPKITGTSATPTCITQHQ